MSVSVTISGQDSISVVSSTPLVNTLEVSSNVVLNALNTATGVLNTATGTLREDISNVSGLITSNDSDISNLQTSTGLLSVATGNLDTKIITVSGLITSNDAEITALNTATGVLNTSVIGLQTATGNLKSDISSNDSDILALQTATGNLKSDISSNDSNISALQTVTGLLKTATGNLDSKIITVSGLITSNDAELAALNTATGTLTTATGNLDSKIITVSGLIVSNDSELTALNTATGLLRTATGILNTNTLSLQAATGILNANVLSLQTATGTLSTATGNLDEKIITISGLIDSNDTDLTDLNTATGVLNTNVIALQTATGSLKSDISSNDSSISALQTATGSLKSDILTSGEINTNINTAIANLVDSAPGTLNTLNELAAALGDDANFSTTTASSLSTLQTATGVLKTATGNLDSKIITVSGLITSNDTDLTALNTATGLLRTATGVLNTNVNALQAVSGSFAQTGTDVNFQNLTVNNNISLSGNITGSIISGGFLFVTGGVGIGTASVTVGHKLEVNGDIKAGNINAAEIDSFGGDGYSIEAKKFAKFENNALQLGDWDDETFTTALFSNGGFETVRISGQKVGIGTTSPQAKLHVTGDTILNGHVGIGSSTPQFPLDIGGTISSTGSTVRINQNNGGTAIRIGAGSASSDVVLMRVDGNSSSNLHDGLTDSGNFGFSMKYMGSEAGNLNALRIISDNQAGTPVNALNILQDGAIGIGTTSPQARLHVDGNITGSIISGGYLFTTGGVGIGLPHPSVGGNAGAKFAVNGNTILQGDLSVIQGNEESLSINTTTFNYKLGDISGGENQVFLELDSAGQFTTLHNSPLKITEKFECRDLVASGLTTLSGNVFVTGRVGIGTSSPNVKLYVDAGATNSIATFQSSDDKAVINIRDNDTNAHLIAKDSKLSIGSGTSDTDKFNVNITNGDTAIAGTTTVGKITLSENTFVIETGSFTLGATHKGATVLLQNSSGINISIPSQVSGYVTTFIAETHNSVSFITGAGMSGLNSFQGASDIAGIYGQAQVIYKSAEYAFLGGNVV